jgi:hypothetical protein
VAVGQINDGRKKKLSTPTAQILLLPQQSCNLHITPLFASARLNMLPGIFQMGYVF